MRKFLHAILSVVLMALPVALSGCGSDEGDKPQDPAKLEAELGFKLTVSEVVTKYFNITVSYTNSQGFTQTYPMPTKANKGVCTLEVIEPVSKFPAEVKIAYSIELNGTAPDEKTIDTYSGIETYAGVYDEQGTCVSGRTMQSSFGSQGLDTGHLDSYIRAFNATCLPTTIRVSAEGKVSVQQ